MNYRRARKSDISAMARIRAADWETEDYWMARISGYLAGEVHPRDALPPRVIYVATEGNAVAGFIAGHLTRRYKCDGELEWIDVIPEYRRSGVASELLRHLAGWFVEKKALRICVDVQPTNAVARKFYAKHGAEKLNEHWLVWKDIGSAFSTPPALKKSTGL
jgi:ribosomal protein S18 acetylase RimI-like enzyme